MPTVDPGGGIYDLFGRRRFNAALGWGFVGVLCFAAGGAVVGGRPLWAGFTLALVALAAVPAVARRRLDAMVRGKRWRLPPSRRWGGSSSSDRPSAA